MGVLNIIATTTETPAPGVFGSGTVTNPTGSGHDNSSVGTSVGNPDVGMSCEFRGYPGSPTLLTRIIKASWSIDGSIVGAGATSGYEIDYSLNGGSSWNLAILRNNVNAPDSGTISITLSTGQDMSLVRVRDLFQCSVADPDTEGANGSMTLSNLRIELVFGDLVD